MASFQVMQREENMTHDFPILDFWIDNHVSRERAKILETCFWSYTTMELLDLSDETFMQELGVRTNLTLYERVMVLYSFHNAQRIRLNRRQKDEACQSNF